VIESMAQHHVQNWLHDVVGTSEFRVHQSFTSVLPGHIILRRSIEQSNTLVSDGGQQRDSLRQAYWRCSPSEKCNTVFESRIGGSSKQARGSPIRKKLR
jgi:hypothetical protein